MTTGAPIARRSLRLLDVNGLSVERGGQLVLDNVDMSVERGDFIAVVGPNGAGKSTLFAALLGLLPAAGRRSAAGPLGYVPQAAPAGRAFPLSALDVALMGAYTRQGRFGRLAREERGRAREALARVGLSEPGATFEQLSAGQRRRVLVARALVQAGQVLLLDEPLSDVDAASAEAILTALDAERAQGRAVVMATHDLAFVRRHATGAVLLNRRVFAAGSPSDVLTAETLAAAYGTSEVLVDEHGHQLFDEGSHHLH